MTSTVTVDMFVSGDGFAGSDGLPGYFGYFGPDLGAWISESYAHEQVLLFGRRSYEILASIPDEHVDDSTRAMLAQDKVVFSRTLGSVSWPTTELCADDAVGHVRQLKETSRVPLRTVGSVSIARQLLDAGLVDRLRLMTFPLLAGPDGREPFFAGAGCATLDLVEQRVLDGRIVLTEWAPTGTDIPRM